MILKRIRKNLFLCTIIFLTKSVFGQGPNTLQSCTGAATPAAGDTTYCFDGTAIKKVSSTGTPGTYTFGKSGSQGNFFFADSKVVTGGTAAVADGYFCDSSKCEKITDTTHTFFNSRASGLDCVYVIGTACNSGVAYKSYFDNSYKKVINCSTNKCTLTTANGYYIDYGSDTASKKYIIRCINNSCESTDHSSETEAEFYINAGLDKSTLPIIYINTDDHVAASIAGYPSGVFLDSDTKSGDFYTNIIVCTTSTKCASKSYDSNKYKSGIFLNSANIHDSDNNDEQELIECNASGCKVLQIDTNAHGNNSNNLYYLDSLTNKLIQCTAANTCSIYNKDTSNKYFLDYGNPSLSSECYDASTLASKPFGTNGKQGFCSLNIISCNSSSVCSSSAIYTDSQFLDGDNPENIIICATFGEDFFCTNVVAADLTYYYINSGNKDEYPLLYCGEDESTTRCFEKKASTVGYYMSDIGDIINGEDYQQNYIGYLISCSTPNKCELSSDIANSGYFVNAGITITGKSLIFFDAETSVIEEQSPTAKDTYYLDASSLLTNTYTNLIYCLTTKNCTSFDPDDGYFLNAPHDDEYDIIIKCDKTGCSIGDLVQICTPSEETVLKPGNYCYHKENGNGDDINFVVNEFTVNSEDIEPTNQNITYTSSGPIYSYASVTSGNFPGITSGVSTLFQINSNSITRVINDGVYIINSRNEQVESISGSINIGSSYSVYTCSSSTQLCTKAQSCTTNTYLFDAENKKGYTCNGNDVSLINEAGYYVDSSYVVNKSLTPAVLKCESTGDCERYNPVETYFINSGFDKNAKALIYCSNKDCKTQEASIGYFRAEFGHSGVIVCTSNTNCKISSLRYNYYINSGEDKTTKPIIACNKNVNCETKKGYIGYYLVQENNSLLINCKMSNSCEVEEGSVGYYYNSANNENTDVETIIKCYTSSYTNSILCATEKKNEGFYLSGSSNNVLINCMGSKCKSITVENGIFRSAASIKTSVKNVSSQGRDAYIDESSELVNRVGRFEEDRNIITKESNVMLRLNEKQLIGRATKDNNENISSLIICSGSVCNELTAEELNLIPVCTYNNDVCYIDNSKTTTTYQSKLITSVVPGDYCTDSSRSTLYFATETIVENNEVISGVVSSSKTTTKNCIKASSQYSSNLFTVGNNIYKVNDGLITEVYESGYYFININKNILVYGTEIKEYNNANVLLYKCDGTSCRIMDRPTSDTYYTDVTKRLIKYSVEENKYSFVNKKENICMFSDNTCTPKYDIAENDFCITAEGNIVVVGEKIKSRETGKCFMSSSISENVLAYSYNSVLYLLNKNAAKRVITSGYYFAENNKYTSAEYKAFNATSSGITLYGCINNNCQIYEPQPDIYYFDMLSNYLIQKKGNDWISPIKVGFINASITPEEVYIYSYTMSDNKELLLTKTNEDGWYYTIDRKMYQCYTRQKICTEIEDSAYVLTNNKELYYCVVDSEGEETECFKRTCNTGQIYYIKDNYYRCSSGSYLELVRSRHCDHDEVVVINFPLIYSETFPISVYNTISNIAKNNHYVPTQKLSRNSLETIQGVFTNCSYNAYDEFATYDQICMQNYVKLNQDKEPDICSVKLLGYTYCTVEDGDNPDKCNPSSAQSQKYLSLWHILTLSISFAFILIFN